MRYTFTVFIALLSFTSIAQQIDWVKYASDSLNDKITAITTDQYGNVYTAGISNITNKVNMAMGKVFIKKTDPTGNLAWSKLYHGNANITDMKINANDELYFTGGFVDSIVFIDPIYSIQTYQIDYIYGKMDLSGNIIWVKSEITSQNNFGKKISFDPSGNFFIAGMDDDVNGLLGKYNSSGVLQWKLPMTGVRTVSDVATDAAGNIYFTGSCQDKAVIDTILVEHTAFYINFSAKIDHSGRALWVKTSPFLTFDFTNRIAVTDNKVISYHSTGLGLPVSGNFFIHDLTGHFIDSTIIIGDELEILVHDGQLYTMRSIQDTLFVEQFDLLFNTISQKKFRGKYINSSAIAVNDEGIFVAGQFIDSVAIFDMQKLYNRSASIYDEENFLLKINNSPTIINEPKALRVEIFPNPLIGQRLNIRSESPVQNVNIYNLQGQFLLSHQFGENTTTIEIQLPDLASGIYIAEVRSFFEDRVVKFIIK